MRNSLGSEGARRSSGSSSAVPLAPPWRACRANAERGLRSLFSVPSFSGPAAENLRHRRAA
eukprot:9467386-Pyramimonas_sp.AAC.1